MSRLSALKQAKSLKDFAALVGFDPYAVNYILFGIPDPEKYRSFEIPKRSGNARVIHAPVDRLKRLQRNLADLLQDCVDELLSSSARRDNVSHGFRRKRSIISNAKRHRRRRWVFNLDIKNFFPSINFGRVRGYFLKNRHFELNERVATLIAQIACHQKCLPQGSPCSPVIANLICQTLDSRLVNLAKSAGCNYSRYADDLTFSTNKKNLPEQIALRAGNEGIDHHRWLPSDELRQIIERSGFEINDRKTHVMYRESRQMVTGIVVNEKLSVPYEYRHKVRAMVHSLISTGSFKIAHPIASVENDVQERPGRIEELQGMLGFIDSLTLMNKMKPLPKDSRANLTSDEKTHRKFLFYSTFFAASKPILVGEGDTDNVYLTHAIRRLARDFTRLAHIGANDKIELRVRLLKYPESSASRLLELKGGGSSGLAALIRSYGRETLKFHPPEFMQPVIIVFDNDDGGDAVWSAIRETRKGRPVESGSSFIHITKNLYVLPTPGQRSKMEDFFTDSTKATLVGDKTFDDKNNFDTFGHYGKKVFAHRNMRPNEETIDFSGFRPLLQTLTSIIEYHEEQSG